jgi:hypothetical protein
MPSPVPKKPRLGLSDDDGSSSAPRPVAMANADAVELPLLTKANYHERALVMQVSLEALELWDAVEKVDGDRAKDWQALATILRVVPLEMEAGLAKKSVKKAWDAVTTTRINDARVKSASVQRLMEFENITFRDGESVDDFTVRINGLVASLRELGEHMEDSRVVKKILRVVPKKLKRAVVAIEMFTNFEEVVGRLRVAEDDDDDEVKELTNRVEQLLLTEEQWEALLDM